MEWEQREILFRGLTIHDKKWVEGYYFACIEEETHYIRVIANDEGNGVDEPPSTYQTDYPVIPESVTQYTGRKDIDKVKIFEADIVSFKNECGNPKYGIVRYDLNSATFYVSSFRLYVDSHGSYILNNENSTQIKIIGNFFQNPELIKKHKLMRDFALKREEELSE